MLCCTWNGPGVSGDRYLTICPPGSWCTGTSWIGAAVVCSTIFMTTCALSSPAPVWRQRPRRHLRLQSEWQRFPCLPPATRSAACTRRYDVRPGGVVDSGVRLDSQGPAFMSESNDFRRQRLSDFLAARLKPRPGNLDSTQKTGVGSGSTTPPSSAEHSRRGANNNDPRARDSSASTREHYPITGHGSSS
jgi:hypothetical protein